mmetsp:Transcript_11593/g.27614  ORF Transcript_11593/g.27614 Transcript_11593/m.27614 type:complete len:238 (-) Transcript_11593:119-832(-)
MSEFHTFVLLVVRMIATPTPAATSTSVSTTVSTSVTAPASSSTAIKSPSSSTTSSTTLFARVLGLLLIVESRNVDPFGGHLELSSLELGSIQFDSVFDRCFRLKLQVCITLWFPRVFVAYDGDAFHRPAGLEVPQELLGCRAVVHLSHVDRAGVAVFSRGTLGGVACGGPTVALSPRCFLLLLLEVVRFLRDSSGFGFHALDFLLQFFEVFFRIVPSFARSFRGGRGVGSGVFAHLE